ncbi:hypothetical protein SEUCBS140593_009459 [Sporothrix eucalyptigena]|uniref:Aminoglycoside phosphotransferase domain-containing protein n=1 Tax=Sporothrix eucalyptigena TaxID=1812306 RepID=A0ABP0CUY9_9PEZI
MPDLVSFRREMVDQIRRHYEEEVKNPPIPRKFGDIPGSYDVITAEWLTATLAPGADIKKAVVKSFTLGPKDDGSANRRRIEIQWEGDDANNTDKYPTSVFCKAAHSVNNRIILSVGGTITETIFYNDVRPLIDIEAPTAYFAGYNPTSWAAILILRDMGSQTHFCTYQTTLTKTQLEEQVQILAKLHGRFYESKEPFFSHLIPYKQRFQNLLDVGAEQACRNGFRAAESEIPARLFAREEEVWPATVKSVERNASLPQTAVHGDVHLGNWYITPSGNMGLTDWQAMARGHWSRDLAYMLGTAVSVENRRAWEHDAVALYVSEFHKAGGPKTTVDEAWLELRRQSLGALAYWTLTLTPSANMPDMQPEAASREFIGRICAMMDDHDALDAFDF